MAVATEPETRKPAGKDPEDVASGTSEKRKGPRRLVWFVAGLVIATMVATFRSDGSPQQHPVAAGPTGAATTTVSVSLSEFSIDPAKVDVPAGTPFTVSVENKGTTQHSFALDTGSGTVQTPMIDPGTGATLKVPALPAGPHHAWCTVPGHEQLGMKATLVAAASGATATTASTGSTSSAGASAGSMPGMSGGAMSAQQMAAAHAASTKAFPAKTAGVGGQVLQPTMQNGVKVYDITANEISWEVSPGVTKHAMAYNGTVPGPELQLHQGDRIRVVFHNELSQPTTIHWHGMTVPNAMDGVPYITQDPVMPGGTFTYAFTVRDPPGLYAYHSHFNSTEQVGDGLYGPIVIEPTHPTADVEYTEMLNDGPLGYTINGKSFPATAPLTAKLGQTVLIHLGNMGSMIHPMHMHGYHFTVLRQDGMPVPEPYKVDTLMIAPGQTYDIQVHATHPGAWAFHCHILPHVEGPQGMFGMVTALIVS